MTLTVYVTRDYEHMGGVAADILLKDLRTLTITQGRLVNLAPATGNSTKGLYEKLIQRQNEFDPTKIRVSSVDELILEPHLHESKGYAVNLKKMFSRLNPNFREINLLDASKISPGELEKEISRNPEGLTEVGSNHPNKGRAYLISHICKADSLRYTREKVLEPYRKSRTNADGFGYTILGVGEDGHVGLHASGIPFGLQIFLVKLDELTRGNLVKDGYFSSIEEAPKYGITLDAGFMAKNSDTVMVLANGTRKKMAIKNALLGSIEDNTPLSILQFYVNDSTRKAIFVVDEKAAEDILGQEKKLDEKGIKVKDLR